MAKIVLSEFKEKETPIGKHNTISESDYWFKDGVFQIRMHGSKNKETKDPEHCTQIIQIEKETAIFLIQELEKHFK